MRCPKCKKGGAYWRVRACDVVCRECQTITTALEFEAYKKQEKKNEIQ